MLIASYRAAEHKIEDMFKEVRKDVIALTKGAQIPWENTSLKMISI